MTKTPKRRAADAELLATKLRIRAAMRAAQRRERETAATSLDALLTTGRGVPFDPVFRPAAQPASIRLADQAAAALDELKPRRMRRDTTEMSETEAAVTGPVSTEAEQAASKPADPDAPPTARELRAQHPPEHMSYFDPKTRMGQTAIVCETCGPTQPLDEAWPCKPLRDHKWHRRDITDEQVVQACSHGTGMDALAILIWETGAPRKVALAAMERACARNLIEYGVSIVRAWAR